MELNTRRRMNHSWNAIHFLVLLGTVASSSVVHGFYCERSKIVRSHHSTMLSKHHQSQVVSLQHKFALKSHEGENDPFPSPQNRDEPRSRRAVMRTVVSTIVGVSGLNQNGEPAGAYYEKTFPSDLDFENGDTSKNIAALREAKIAKQRATRRNKNAVGPKDVLTWVTWGGALWLLSGSRSNPLVTPLANAIYNQDDEQWLKDRNEGLFASVPPLLFVVLAVVFGALGIITDRGILLATQGEANVSLQLAGVSLISGGALELGRIFSGEKGQTRQESDRDSQLQKEFSDFAQNRLVSGGNCHRSEVVKAFRRYYAKYRQSDNDEYPLADIEIERMLRSWNRKMGNQEMSSAGFFSGIQINDQADVFVKR